jgi:hypothetical protein
MLKIVPTLAAAGLMIAGVAFDAQAMPTAPITTDQAPGVTLVAGGCGWGAHRGPWGGCRRNWGGWGPGYGYGYRRCWWRPTPWGPRRVCRW